MAKRKELKHLHAKLVPEKLLQKREAFLQVKNRKSLKKPISFFDDQLISIDSLKELWKHEKEILKRIAQVEKGGQLFLAHPFLLFKDIGVVLSDEVEKAIRQREPALASLSSTVYQAIKTSKVPPSTTIHLNGLFKRDRGT